jgi:hypothetical protein
MIAPVLYISHAGVPVGDFCNAYALLDSTLMVLVHVLHVFHVSSAGLNLEVERLISLNAGWIRFHLGCWNGFRTISPLLMLP